MCSPRQNPITSEDIDIFMRTTDMTKMKILEKKLIDLGYTLKSKNSMVIELHHSNPGALCFQKMLFLTTIHYIHVNILTYISTIFMVHSFFSHFLENSKSTLAHHYKKFKLFNQERENIYEVMQSLLKIFWHVLIFQLQEEYLFH